MNRFFLVALSLWRDEEGVTAIEYALMASTIAVAVIVTVLLLGQEVHKFYLHVLNCILSPSTCVV